MNLQRLELLATALEANQPLNGELGFNMAFFSAGRNQDTEGNSLAPMWDMTGHNCGTVGCIGGWADVLFESRVGLELDFYQSSELFYPLPGHAAWGCSPRQAARVVRHLMKTGKVDWDQAVGPV